MLSGVRKRGRQASVALALTVATILATAGSADAAPRKPAGEDSGCNYNVCINVSGDGYQMKHVQVHPVSGYTGPVDYVAIDARFANGALIRRTGWGHSLVDFVGYDFSGGTQFCGQIYYQNQDIGGYPCVSAPF